ncbi:hypothetical protein [Echinimonas agarilytica]|uniref:Uncharacterized protein n=1 Tax=Echinimonas agarilytica TaxID=1215918 RepID=A0AA42B668_9GAMM|nr:hypothetical protein [Echinimonas agarilytica]MCM2678131.1 hypothetical protein [Echinimonas agarilytica]
MSLSVSEHGQWTITFKPDQIELVLSDSFNSEGILALRKAAQKVVREHLDSRLSKAYCDMRCWGLTTASAHHEIKGMHDGMYALGIHRIAYVAADNLPLARFIIERCWEHLPDVERAYFLSEHEARAWLHQSSTKDGSTDPK